MPAGSKTDLLLTKAKPVSEGGSASGRKLLRRGKICCERAFERGEWDYMRERALQTPGSVKKEGEEVLQALDQRFSCSLWWRPWWGRLPPCSPWRSTVEQISTWGLWKTPSRSRWMRRGGCDPMGSPCWSRLLAGSVDPWTERSPCWSRFAGRACDPVEHLRWSRLFLKDFTPWEGTHAGAAFGELPPMRKTSRWSRGRVWGVCPWGGRSGRDNVWWTDRNPHSPSPCATRWEEVEKLGVKLSPRRRQAGGGKVFLRFGCISHHSTLIWLMTNYTFSPSSVCFACDINWWVLSLSLSRPTSLSLLCCFFFAPPVHLRRGSDRATLVGIWHSSRLNHDKQYLTLFPVPVCSSGFAAQIFVSFCFYSYLHKKLFTSSVSSWPPAFP